MFYAQYPLFVTCPNACKQFSHCHIIRQISLGIYHISVFSDAEMRYQMCSLKEKDKMRKSYKTAAADTQPQVLSS